MSFQDKIKKYARLAVETGVNIQKGQLLVINGDVDCAWYIREVVKAAYEAGAGEVVFNTTMRLSQRCVMNMQMKKH